MHLCFFVCSISLRLYTSSYIQRREHTHLLNPLFPHSSPLTPLHSIQSAMLSMDVFVKTVCESNLLRFFFSFFFFFFFFFFFLALNCWTTKELSVQKRDDIHLPLNPLADCEKEKKEHMKLTSSLKLYIHASDISLGRKKETM